MNRQNIILSDFEYICDLYDYEELTEKVLKKYVIIRNLDFINGVACDNDILFIEKDIYEKIVNDGYNTTNYTVFPVNNNKFGSFSKSYVDFSELLNINNFKSESNGGNVFSLYTLNEDTLKYEETYIKCDEVRIYHPYNKPDLDYIIYFDNLINGIHFHYFCNYNSNCEIHSETEFKIDNNIYSEYIQFYIPNLSFLFKEYEITRDENGNPIEDNNIYFNDIFNIVKYIDYCENQVEKETQTWFTSTDAAEIGYIYKEDNSAVDIETYYGFVPLHLLLNPYIVNDLNSDRSEKIYFKLNFDECNNYNSFPINITLYPYDESDNNLLLVKTDYPANSDTFVKERKFNLVSKLGFSNNQLCVINNFKYNNTFLSSDVSSDNSVQKVYANYNGLTLYYDEDTEKYTYSEYKELTENIFSKYTYDDLNKLIKSDKLSDSDREAAISWRNKLDDYEESETFYQNNYIKCCGYQIDIATDYNFTNIIMTDYQEMDIIDNFEFSLSNLFSDWFVIPQTLILRIQFIDKYLGIILKSGLIILNKKWVKYAIDNTTIRMTLNEKQDSEKINTTIEDMGWNKIDASSNNTYFNFIDKINCIVNKQSSTQNITNAQTGLKIIYKPIFYKTQALQTITLKSNLKQKVGINLSAYMTKVSIFKLIIDDIEISEYGRNDIYVIFEINAAVISDSSGEYNIVDTNGDYISTGTYSIS